MVKDFISLLIEFSFFPRLKNTRRKEFYVSSKSCSRLKPNPPAFQFLPILRKPHNRTLKFGRHLTFALNRAAVAAQQSSARLSGKNLLGLIPACSVAFFFLFLFLLTLVIISSVLNQGSIGGASLLLLGKKNPSFADWDKISSIIDRLGILKTFNS